MTLRRSTALTRMAEMDFSVVAEHDVDGKVPPYAYTVGRARRPGRAYELACTGVAGPLAQIIIRRAADQLVRDLLDPAEGLELDEVVNGDRVRLHQVQDAARLRRDGAAPAVPFWQILLPDAWGLFPGDPHCSFSDEVQPLL
ncbi:DUF4262 domain-containing protein [Streptomyces sp. SID8381]|uniref:DUF4262 domain-containing protein n=1 Tax=unclassified Streptomyces TaxID=2593676 RepID=UPI000368FA79|nr:MULTISPECIES: DUF4262 domain-containing protein [unclassified Streptomyces]MYX26817.1 DUF4262 domain-containing protein [Streptomyces sp. SID8381]